MPEGDTIFKLAAYLQPALSGRRLLLGRLRHEPSIDLSGSTIEDVYAHGKHLFIAIEGGDLLRTHLGMWGSWHGYAPGEEWQRPRRQASVVLDVGERIYVCFNALQVELLRRNGVRARQLGVLLGPDLMQETTRIKDIVGRARELCEPSTPLADLLLNQRVACGIGNVYKSEVLFVQRCHPATAMRALDDAALAALYGQARTLLNGNRRDGPRITRRANDDAGNLWVYGRTGQPCHRCDTAIESMRFGRGQRSTFWCPRCQPAGPNVR
ncbi:MAG: formamidopyrimidine DNA glycosylase [Gammaproteobacteria bacterium]|nr:formamidopyrimidine DNA glycosylase [Gammaproteobacteria bacterium]